MNTSRRLFLAGASLIAVNLAGEGSLRPGRCRDRRGLAGRHRRHPEIRPPRQLERRFRRPGQPGRQGRLQAADLLAADRHLCRAGDRPVSADRRAGRLADGAGHQEAQARRDRSRRRGAAQAADDFGRPVAARRHLAILRHLCRRRGEALPDASRPAGRRRHGQVHLRRAEHQRAGAARPARDQPGAAALDVRLPRRPLRDGQHPGRPDRGGRERPRRAAPHGDRRQDRPADADRQFQDQRDHRQSLLERAGIDRAQGHHSADAEGSEVSLQEQHPHPRSRRHRDRSDHDRLEHRGRGEIPPPPGSRAPATPWPR